MDDEGRRNFLKIMGASLALAGLSACTKQPTEYTLPYVEEPEKMVTGKPLFYATAFPVSGVANPILVETHEFRPTKVEAQSGTSGEHGRGRRADTGRRCWGLYDPDRRADRQLSGREIRSYTSFLSSFLGYLDRQKANNGAGLRILTETVTSPSLFDQMQQVLKLYPAAKWIQWEPTGHGRRMGTQMAFGQYPESRSTGSIRPRWCFR